MMTNQDAARLAVGFRDAEDAVEQLARVMDDVLPRERVTRNLTEAMFALDAVHAATEKMARVDGVSVYLSIAQVGRYVYG